MILTLTLNPSIDATMQLADRLRRGLVHRPAAMSQVAGGKGVNVTHALTLAEKLSLALFPADSNDPFVALARQAGIPFHSIPVAEGVRINTTVTEPDGTTTKFNGHGATIEPATLRVIEDTVLRLAGNASWLVMSGSLPPGVPDDWYTSLIAAAKQTYPDIHIAVDTSDKAMRALGAGLEVAAPTLIKPNGLELGQLVGRDGQAMEDAAARGDLSEVVDAARIVIDRGIEEILVTLGSAGAVLVTSFGAWFATPPPVEVQSTVGAGDSSLAGYLMARAEGVDPAGCLARAVAYGTAATALPGTTLPSPTQLNLKETHVRHLC
ncbi:1-phosphofructokinase family hexose kinase [Corynebacterium sp.]|uniref:1-phosphofructokinase family hexose kinase n=1 Tax=Corynebacterium sp. TaxID=1720 RepID=UPI0026DF07FA|nr:1-phosphofructokinase family hexose kinase [Corynebacterium sp.]MDO5511306.1 1-phosphofructokinase family hexose kinase [Corynebacterium sp.]